jgi:hypothetical protein
MKINIEITPEEFKDLLTPGPNQVKIYNELMTAATKSWMETIGAMQKNAWLWKKD